MHERRNIISDNAGSNRWLLTYADVITLLLALFVMMILILQNSSNSAIGILSSRNSILSVNSEIPIHSVTITPSLANPVKTQQLRLESLALRIKQASESHHLYVALGKTSIGVVIHLPSDSLFQSGQDTLTAKARASLLAIVPILQSVPNSIIVAGSTDDIPIHNSSFYSNLELSTGRADAISEFLISAGVSPSRLIATGLSQYYPVASNGTAAGRAQNRRVDLYILREPLQTEMF